MRFSNKTLGKTGEDIAADYLKKNSYKIIDRNWKNQYGEIDIIAEKKNNLVFVEVKSKNKNQILPETKVDFSKRKKLTKIVKFYLTKNNFLDRNFQIDIIVVEFNKGSIFDIRHHQNVIFDI